MEERVGAVMTPERLAEFGEAWNEQDVDLVMGYMTQDCSYHASFGPAPGGESYIGREAVREGVARFFERYPGGRFEDSRVFVAGDRGAAEWTFAYTGTDGGTVRVRAATCSSSRETRSRRRMPSASRSIDPSDEGREVSGVPLARAMLPLCSVARER